jgi:hypothetical protein
MRAKLKGLHSADVLDLENWTPESGPFGFSLQAMIGPSDSEGAESFSLTVCTPEWFSLHRMNGGMTSGHHTVFVTNYNYRSLVVFLERAVQRAEGTTWRELAEGLAWLGEWEFASYRP